VSIEGPEEDELPEEGPTEQLEGLGEPVVESDRSTEPTEVIQPERTDPDAPTHQMTGEPEGSAAESTRDRWSPPPGSGLLALSIWSAIALSVAYIFAGGPGYKPTPVADPCDPRAWTQPETIEQTAQQFAFSALDGAACDLGVTREALTRALASRESLDRFGRENDLSSAEIESAIRSGAGRAIDDAQQAEAISPVVAFGLKIAVRTLPLQDLIELIQNASSLLEGEEGLDSLLPDVLDGLEEGLGGEGGFDLGEALEGITGPDGLDLEGGLEGLLGPDGPDLRKGLEGLFGGGGGDGLDFLPEPESQIR
jgi:hypothetical protein